MTKADEYVVKTEEYEKVTRGLSFQAKPATPILAAVGTARTPEGQTVPVLQLTGGAVTLTAAEAISLAEWILGVFVTVIKV